MLLSFYYYFSLDWDYQSKLRPLLFYMIEMDIFEYLG